MRMDVVRMAILSLLVAVAAAHSRRRRDRRPDMDRRTHNHAERCRDEGGGGRREKRQDRCVRHGSQCDETQSRRHESRSTWLAAL